MLVCMRVCVCVYLCVINVTAVEKLTCEYVRVCVQRTSMYVECVGKIERSRDR